MGAKQKQHKRQTMRWSGSARKNPGASPERYQGKDKEKND